MSLDDRRPPPKYRSATSVQWVPNDLVEMWQEWEIPTPTSYFTKLQHDGDFVIDSLNIAPNDAYYNEKRDLGTVEIRANDKSIFEASIAMLMDAHCRWVELVEEFTKIPYEKRVDPTLLKMPLSIGRNDLFQILVSGSNERYTLCVRLRQLRDIR